MDLLLNGIGGLVTKDVENNEVLKAFFASAFISKICLQESQVLEGSGKSGARKTPLVEDDQVREYLSKLNMSVVRAG